MNGCIVLFGESFRLGGQGTKNRGSDKSYTEQINAAHSHLSFIKDLQAKNICIDVCISSYTTKFDNDLLKVYSDVLIAHEFYEDLIGPSAQIQSALVKLGNIDKYNFVFLIRVDLFLKPKFIELFNANWDKIMWPSICMKPHHKWVNHPRVNDMMIFVPRKYFAYLKDLHYNYDGGHAQWKYYVDSTDLTYNDLDTILNTYHDSDSAKDYNPLYSIVNRQVATIHQTPGEIFNKTIFLYEA
jgi:hypothetical protein